jgi:pimeloyl-ACP methyl ester carboxylesterase
MGNQQTVLTKRSIDFPVKWAHWLADTIPGAKPPVELKGARIFFPEEHAEVFNKLLRDHLLAAQRRLVCRSGYGWP